MSINSEAYRKDNVFLCKWKKEKNFSVKAVKWNKLMRHVRYNSNIQKSACYYIKD